MTGWNDLPDEMRGERIDAGTMERLLRGRMTPDDAPPGYSDVASILLAAASPTRPEEIAMEVTHVTAARSILLQRPTHRRSTRRTVTGLIVAGALLAIPGLAAASSLPAPAEHAVSNVLQKVGITVPANTEHPSPTPSTAAHPASTGSDISTIATTTTATGVAKGAEISTAASGGKSQAGQHGQAANHGAPVTTPNGGGTGTGDTASGGASDQGSATAGDHSGGRSAAGSGNSATG